MMIDCKESAIRSSQLREQHVKGIRKLELWYHLVICKFCRIYYKQVKTLGVFSRMMGEASCRPGGCDEQMPEVKLSEEAKTRIKNNIISA